ncbi:iron-sulfur-binding ferredoxin reductase [Phytopseudomonas punonensis]|uniref:NAD(P)H-flavin reductase n=1 Tax=Phytopseudomonas punonensis TaxID=1220495 RepID=A0A1M7FEU2_9GAMM|nr:iron-sulfur-binding ferredoxin reductase [Pseudomonas punonensis]SHM02571.1 NAD(P)H-flavin reductase [Pseudomonas punonensis]
MPELQVGERHWDVAAASNLLDALLAAGVAVPHSCRAGSCQACLVRCVAGEPEDAKPDALDATRREQGWRLACQCRVSGPLQLEVFDPRKDALPAQVQACDLLSERVLRLRLLPQQPLRYRAGQHLLLWTADGIARPYSFASLPGEDASLEFHVDCSRPGAFCDAARLLQVGDSLRLGALSGGALHYDPDWQEKPLWLLGAGTGLAPLYAVLREALRQEHLGPIRLVHVASSSQEHYLAGPLRELAERHPQLHIELIEGAALSDFLATLRPTSRQTVALLCGRPDAVEAISRRLYLAGLPRRQVLTDLFLPRA